LCTLVGAPAAYRRQLPAPILAINLQHALLSHHAELVKNLEADSGRIELRAVTGPQYGRIWDHELWSRHADCRQWHRRHPVESAGRAGLVEHDPQPVGGRDQNTTTLNASDRDVFLFSGRRHQPNRSGTAAGRFAGCLFSRHLLLKQRGRKQDARH
jgi:hypothetical protein